ILAGRWRIGGRYRNGEGLGQPGRAPSFRSLTWINDHSPTNRQDAAPATPPIHAAEQEMSEASEIERLDVTAVNSAAVRKPLYAARKKIFPKRAEGSFRRFKWIVMLVTLGI